VLRVPKDTAVRVNLKPAAGCKVNSKAALPLLSMLRIPVRAAAPALKLPLEPVYPDDALVVDSMVVVPLLLYWETAGAFRLVMADDEGVALPGGEVPKFHSMICAWAALAAHTKRNKGLMNRSIEVMAGWLVGYSVG
jgi:hypothetical protein